MKYQELYRDYRHFMNEEVALRRKLEELPNGHLTIKKISGKEYTYLQSTVNGKKKSDYIRAELVSETEKLLALRKNFIQKLAEINNELGKLEQAARILDSNLSRLFFHIKSSAPMDALPIPQRKKALAFATAMTALEGLPAKKQTELHLALWISGKASFQDYYLTTLKGYQILEVQL